MYFPFVFSFCFVLMQLLLGVSYCRLLKHSKEAADCPIGDNKLYNDLLFTRRKRNGLSNPIFRWPRGIACYVISGNFTEEEKNLIRSTLNTNFEGTCLKPTECTTCCNDGYIEISTNNGGSCLTNAGYQGYRQDLLLGEGCVNSRAVLHLFLHSVGFLHEITNPNRDNYVDILEDNIDPGQLYNFDKYSPQFVTSFGQPYDYCSIMHFSECAFSINGKKTVIPKQAPDCHMGNVDVLSSIDIQKLNLMYCQGHL